MTLPYYRMLSDLHGFITNYLRRIESVSEFITWKTIQNLLENQEEARNHYEYYLSYAL